MTSIPEKFRGLPPLHLFRQGYGTDAIAKFLNITEAQALEIVSKQRGAQLGLPSGYSDPRPSKTFWPSGRVGFAGRV